MVVAAAMAAMWCATVPLAAQGSNYSVVDNPFQEEFDYAIGTDLEPGVEVDGVQWVRFSLRPRSDREFPPDRPVPVIVELDLVNTSDSADILVIVLFEDEHGIALDRLELGSISAGRDRPREVVQKHKVIASVLDATRKVYLFFEVSR